MSMWLWSRRSDGTALSQAQSTTNTEASSATAPTSTTGEAASSRFQHREITFLREQNAQLRGENADLQATACSQNEHINSQNEYIEHLEEQLDNMSLQYEQVRDKVCDLHLSVETWDRPQIGTRRPEPNESKAIDESSSKSRMPSPSTPPKHSTAFLNRRMKESRSIVFPDDSPPKIVKRQPLRQLPVNVPTSTAPKEGAATRLKERGGPRAMATQEETTVARPTRVKTKKKAASASLAPGRSEEVKSRDLANSNRGDAADDRPDAEYLEDGMENREPANVQKKRLPRKSHFTGPYY